MTPLQIAILTFAATAERNDFNDGDFRPPAIRAAIDGLARDGLIAVDEFAHINGKTLVPTERGRVFIDALCSLPLPVQAWRMPIQTQRQEATEAATRG